MSENRDIKLDIENTKRKIKNLPVENEGKKNWLGHSGGGAIIDEMLLSGSTKIELDAKHIREHGSSSHISHLRKFHGLQITYPNNGGICRFNYPSEIDEVSKVKNDIENTYFEKLKNINETDKSSIVSQRVGQDTLRKFILQLYNNKCAMCDVDAVEVLTVSHIVPWSADESIRLEPENAILLCGLHDLAFDKRLITINDNFSISFPDKPDGLLKVLKKITYKKLNLPNHEEYYPKEEYLERHRVKNIN
ncbi:HNH endonuclease [Aureibaculum sp. 2210JD6-5]|uniref:HNH endonuclease n=1 Tax=Aureibaculum sp. 2210JD6-5 TaxID=3103957 RepID=UPI002AACDC10|nr:HNH endonuclease [Aureibaculum sp. 2210JD6-5]MDY7394868.1 HNH endonuclease [Aureibaculum sp. 2210JD6-5]